MHVDNYDNNTTCDAVLKKFSDLHVCRLPLNIKTPGCAQKCIMIQFASLNNTLMYRMIRFPIVANVEQESDIKQDRQWHRRLTNQQRRCYFTCKAIWNGKYICVLGIDCKFCCVDSITHSPNDNYNIRLPSASASAPRAVAAALSFQAFLRVYMRACCVVGGKLHKCCVRLCRQVYTLWQVSWTLAHVLAPIFTTGCIHALVMHILFTRTVQSFYYMRVHHRCFLTPTCVVEAGSFSACCLRGGLCLGRGRDRGYVLCIFLLLRVLWWWVGVCLYTRVHTHRLLGYSMWAQAWDWQLKSQKNPDWLKRSIYLDQIGLPANLLDYFLWSE